MGQGDGGGVGPAPTEEGDVVLGGNTLRPSDDGNLAGVERLTDAVRIDLEDPGVAVGRVGQETVGVSPLVFERSLQAQFLIPMAASLAFGILFATAILMLLVPALAMVQANVAEWWEGRQAGRVTSAVAEVGAGGD